jgi:hypothetical protein
MTSQRTVLSRLTLVAALLLTSFSITTTADANRRDRNRQNMARAERFCAQQIRPHGIQCKVKQCGCGLRWRRVNYSTNRRSRAFCSCVPKSAWLRVRNINRMRARRVCERYNARHAGTTRGCFVSTSCRPKNRLSIQGRSARLRMKVFACKRTGRISRD